MKIGLGQRLKSIFNSAKIDIALFDDIEDALIEADMGCALAVEIVKTLKEDAKVKKITDRDILYNELKEIIGTKLSKYTLNIDKENLTVILFLGVNGVGKTTTIAKTVHLMQKDFGNPKIVLSAADTFRAAAIDQLKIHGERLGVRVVSQQHGSDPGAVIFDTIDSAKNRGENIILADTAGRMHNKDNLVRELQKIDKIIKGKIVAENYIKFLIIDSTTGQNGFNQAEIFNEAIGIDAIILTKQDSNAKGGCAVAISGKLGIPIVFIGTGEKYDDINYFEKKEFLNNMLGIE